LTERPVKVRTSRGWGRQVFALAKISSIFNYRFSFPAFGSSVLWFFVDQFQRASLSIPLNLAEGNGRWHAAEKRQFFWIARGSVFECIPLFEILKRKKLISDAQYKNARDRLDHLGRMLTKLVQAHETPKGGAI
jgi:four helix bundle protein